jgi:serine/threonine-protein kinase
VDEESIFAVALGIPASEERQAFLVEACGGDSELQRSLEALLKAHENPDSFLEPRVATCLLAIDAPPAEAPGTVIGPYRLLEQIGESGMGLVFMAEQSAPVRRKVALKVLKPGMDTRHVLARFEAERQALALMDHPNIATIHDGGTTESGGARREGAWPRGCCDRQHPFRRFGNPPASPCHHSRNGRRRMADELLVVRSTAAFLTP